MNTTIGGPLDALCAAGYAVLADRKAHTDAIAPDDLYVVSGKELRA